MKNPLLVTCYSFKQSRERGADIEDAKRIAHSENEKKEIQNANCKMENAKCKIQISRNTGSGFFCLNNLEIEIWNLFGIWNLEFGISGSSEKEFKDWSQVA